MTVHSLVCPHKRLNLKLSCAHFVFPRLSYIQSGRVRIENESTGELIFNKMKGDFLGEWSLLGDWQWIQLPGIIPRRSFFVIVGVLYA